jgi:hypothetical protein
MIRDLSVSVMGFALFLQQKLLFFSECSEEVFLDSSRIPLATALVSDQDTSLSFGARNNGLFDYYGSVCLVLLTSFSGITMK